MTRLRTALAVAATLKEQPMKPIITIRGILGWGNRKSGLDAYGPGGRWGGPGVFANRRGDGDLLGDALYELGAREGADLIVVALNRGTLPGNPNQAKRDAQLDYVLTAVGVAVSTALSEIESG